MASRPKSGRTGNQRSSARSRKPATIDLKAKEVGTEGDKTSSTAAGKAASSKTTTASAKPAASKPAASEKSPAFGRSAKTSEKPSDKKPEPASKPSDTAKKPVENKPAPEDSGRKAGGIISGLTGAVVAIAGLGAIGQIDGARNLPLIGSLYGGAAPTVSGAADADALVALQNKVAELEAQSGNGPNIDLEPVNSKISALESAVAAISEASADETSAEDALLAGRIDAVESGLAGLKETLAGLEPAAGANGDGSSDLANTLEALGVRLAAVEEGASNNAASAEQLASIREQLDGLSGKLGDIEAKTAANAKGLSSLSSQSTELKDTVATVQASEKVAKSVAVNALATAIRNDDPLTLPIASLEALIGESPETARLTALAQAGIPTVKELVAGLDSFTGGIQNPSKVSDNASLSEKFWANAQSLVSFRSSGPRDGDDPLAILSRVKDAVEKDNLVGANDEWMKLPAEVRETGQSWADQLAVRMEAYALQEEISSKLALQAG